MFGGGGCGWRRERLESVAAGTGRELDQVRMMKLSFASGPMLLSVDYRYVRYGGVRLKESLDEVARAHTFGAQLAIELEEVGLKSPARR